jgi:hypothetical protein
MQYYDCLILLVEQRIVKCKTYSSQDDEDHDDPVKQVVVHQFVCKSSEPFVIAEAKKRLAMDALY